MKWLSVAGAILAGVLANQPSGVPDGGELAERLAQFDEKTARIEDLTASFEQQKHSALLRNPLVSHGEVHVKGETVRWDTHEPIKSVMRVGERDARIYYPDQGLVEVYELGADLRALAGSPVPRLTALGEQFEIQPTDMVGLEGVLPSAERMLVVSLTPRDERLRERIERLRLVLDEEAGVLRVFEILDSEGDRSVIIFNDIRTNEGLTDEDISLEVPPDTEVSYPLGGGGGGEGGTDPAGRG